MQVSPCKWLRKLKSGNELAEKKNVNYRPPFSILTLEMTNMHGKGKTERDSLILLTLFFFCSLRMKQMQRERERERKNGNATKTFTTREPSVNEKNRKCLRDWYWIGWLYWLFVTESFSNIENWCEITSKSTKDVNWASVHFHSLRLYISHARDIVNTISLFYSAFLFTNLHYILPQTWLHLLVGDCTFWVSLWI